ncbi:T9SS type A sorting domain-containing protein [Epilithonimonas sp. JDS]|uniref:T9SS type A sorting domain-containing protein n=1 Tax=Epilithonimonas sp. JDS TaxID=2902797 RepID=UPI001E59F267|nr:T9SS type A sorting domain-containing protein [Epilithonimonas sp. JDS]MCD9856316.1 T9SS type A sorting domain-containing protein [Epilithonimonas sp. JDS]
MKKALLILGILTIGSKLFGQTTYTTTTFGRWDDPAHWVGGVVPPSTLGTGDVVNINHNTFFYGQNIINNGTFNIKAIADSREGTKITNNGKMILTTEGRLYSNDNDSDITNNYAIDNSGVITQIGTFTNNGYVFNQGHIINYQKLFYDGVTMNCSDWGTLINNNVLCNNNGGFVNNDCGSVTTGAPAITSCDDLKSTIMNASLAVGETGKSKEMKVYPNPTTGVFKIDLDSNSEVKIFDMTGKSIVSKNSQIDGNSQTFDISNLPKGTYILKIKTADNNEVIKKIIKK